VILVRSLTALTAHSPVDDQHDPSCHRPRDTQGRTSRVMRKPAVTGGTSGTSKTSYQEKSRANVIDTHRMASERIPASATAGRARTCSPKGGAPEAASRKSAAAAGVARSYVYDRNSVSEHSAIASAQAEARTARQHGLGESAPLDELTIEPVACVVPSPGHCSAACP
jgi:hypothetical protein